MPAIPDFPDFSASPEWLESSGRFGMEGRERRKTAWREGGIWLAEGRRGKTKGGERDLGEGRMMGGWIERRKISEQSFRFILQGGRKGGKMEGQR